MDEASQATRSRKFLYIAACLANLTAFTCGIGIGWTSPILPKLTNNTENTLPKPATLEEASWIGGMLPIGAIIGPFAAGAAVDYIGRKATLTASSVPAIVAFVMFAFARSVTVIQIARFISGISVGVIFTVLPMYVGEIADVSVRGALGSFLQLFLVAGVLFSYSVGPYTTIRDFNLLCIFSPLIFFFVMTAFIPETPQFYISKNRLKDASHALARIRSCSENGVEDELIKMKSSVDEAMANRGGINDIFKNRATKKALFLSLYLLIFQQLSGSSAVVFYAQNIFEDTGFSIAPEITTIIIGVVQIFACFITPAIVERSGRRMLLILSGLFMCISEAVLAYYFYKLNSGDDVSSLFWLPLSCLVIFVIFFRLGFGSLPFAIMGELFPANVKSAALTLSASMSWLSGFIVTKSFSPMVVYLGTDGSFAIFSIFSLIGAVGVYMFLPETSGKTLQEIQELLAA